MTSTRDRPAVDSVHGKLDEIVALVDSARAMPMSASCVVNRGELLDLLEDLRALLPAALGQAQAVLADREAVVAEGRREADRIREQAEQERQRLLSEHEIYARAQEEAERLLAEARTSAETVRAQVEDYVDAKLANFEIVLTKTLSAVERGRQKLSGRTDLDDLAAEEPGEL